MRKSLSLSAYLTLRRSEGHTPNRHWTPRSVGPLIWVHCETRTALSAAAALAVQLRQNGDDITVLCTTMVDQSVWPDGLVCCVPPAETLAACRGFLDHWNPDTFLWIDGGLRPALLAEAAKHPMQKFVVDVTATSPHLSNGGRFPGLARACLTAFDTAICADRSGVQRLERAGLPASHIRHAGRFDPAPQIRPCVETERQEFASLLASRPVWLAADVPACELDDVLTAYRIASKRAHKLLLILSTSDPETLAQRLSTSEFAVRTFGSGALPSDGTQIYLTDTEDMGLWYRLSPLTYIGGTLRGGQTSDPFEAAALGSVVVHGRHTDHHTHRFEQLADTNACRLVTSQNDLGRVIETLLAPDKAAVMAHAAWDATSKGAETADMVLNLLRASLGLQEEHV